MTVPVQTFRERMEDKQSVYKTEFLEIKQMGLLRGQPLPHVLPEDAWSLNLWREISYDAVKYFARHDIPWNPQKHSMLSSQVLCVNIFFPLKEHLNIIHNWMQMRQFDVGEVLDIYFEYTSPKNYLNEKDERGQGAAGTDLAIHWLDMAKRNNLLLLEFRFTESSLGECSPQGNPNPKRCYAPRKIAAGHRKQCYRSQQGRRYWDIILSAGSPVWKDSILVEKYCPFRYDFFNLMRGQLLAHSIQADSKSDFDRVEFGVMYHEGNDELLRMSHTFDGERDPLKVWPTLLHKPETFHSFTMQEFFNIVEPILPFDLTLWREYINQRYGI